MRALKIIFHLIISTSCIAPASSICAQQKNDTLLQIPLPDGTVLRGLLVTMDSTRQLPVILRVSCYPSTGLTADLSRAEKIAQQGFAAVVVYNRGKGGSQGTFVPFENDASDNYDIIDWISRQAWCNGKLGMYGGSYLGFAQWAAMKKIHPALKTIVPQAAVAPGIDYPNPGGIFLTYALQWLKYVGNGPYNDKVQMTDQGRWDTIFKRYLSLGIAFKKMDSLEGHGSDPVFQRWLSHVTNDSYWQRMIPNPHEYAKINIPILTITGYFDDDQGGAISYYQQHQQYGNPAAVRHHYLVIGPWDHAGAQGRYSPSLIAPYSVDSSARIDQFALLVQWFNYTLNDGPKPSFLKDRVCVFEMGSNRWQYFSSLEKMKSSEKNFYLNKDSLLSVSSVKTGKISKTWSGAVTKEDLMPQFQNNSSVLSPVIFQRKNIFCFYSPVLTSDILLNGSPSARLSCSIDGPDADLMLSWWELDPMGHYWPLSQTVQRLSGIMHPDRRVLLKSGNVYNFQFKNTSWICKKISKGSRLLFLISPATNVYWQKNYGVSKPVAEQTGRDSRPINVTIFTGAQYNSVVSLPLSHSIPTDEKTRL